MHSASGTFSRGRPVYVVHAKKLVEIRFNSKILLLNSEKWETKVGLWESDPGPLLYLGLFRSQMPFWVRLS